MGILLHIITMNREFDVIIIGGGATGAGVARDCALRGIKALLIERHDIATGATGRNHGLLHSGARYAVNDRESAEECIRENMILRRIASHCVEDTGGIFISLPEDGLDFQKKFINIFCGMYLIVMPAGHNGINIFKTRLMNS